MIPKNSVSWQSCFMSAITEQENSGSRRGGWQLEWGGLGVKQTQFSRSYMKNTAGWCLSPKSHISNTSSLLNGRRWLGGLGNKCLNARTAAGRISMFTTWYIQTILHTTRFQICAFFVGRAIRKCMGLTRSNEYWTLAQVARGCCAVVRPKTTANRIYLCGNLSVRRGERIATFDRPSVSRLPVWRESADQSMCGNRIKTGSRKKAARADCR